ncbi:hypothetical protein RhiirA1_465419 [Rhizophagus irregularis]|uniref:DUF659 domain-containing protein n=1 Tax=Rhizophagus irregularis TaxID=588596 RepID=A0A2N0RG10_9GLOM|nr:hypothetical protein RhiirA1_465419 [Rhizophagus irregularis]
MACHKFTTLPISTAPVTPTTPVTLTTTSENNDTIHPKHAGGRPPNPVWEYFEKEPLPSAGYFSDDKSKITKSRKKRINQAWVKAFVGCGIPFSAIENPFFIDAIKSFWPAYNPPSCNHLSRILLNYKVIKINSKVENILKNAENLTLDRQEFLHSLKNLSAVSHMADLIKSEILEIIEKIGSEKFVAIVLDNASAVAATRQRISDTYPHIMNIHCIAHFVNLISKDILEHIFPKHILKWCNILSRFFKTSHQGRYFLNKYITELGGLKNYCKPQWTSSYKTIKCENYDIIINQSIRKILNSRGFFYDCNQVATILEPLRSIGLSNDLWHKIGKYAGELLKNFGYNDTKKIIANMSNFKCEEGIYKLEYCDKYHSPRTW